MKYLRQLTCIVILSWLTILSGCSERIQGVETSPLETLLGTYRKDVSGGFSHRWVAYIIEPQEGDKDKNFFVELNGQRLGPYTDLSRMFEVSPDGEHIAFAVKKEGRWHIVLDGEEKWLHAALMFPWCAWTPTLEGRSYIPQTRAAVLQFSRDGKKLAHFAKLDDGKWAVFVNGRPGPGFSAVGTQLSFVGGKITYHAWLEDEIVKVCGDTMFGPYETTWRTKLSEDGNHFCFAAKKKDLFFIILDGREQKLPGEIITYEIVPSGQLAYAYKSGKVSKVRFGAKELPGEYDEVTRITISPDGKHVAFWGRTGEKWSVVTETKKYPGFEGYYFYRSGGEEYSILWGPESKNLAYFAGKEKDRILALNGEEMPETFANLPGFALTHFVDDKGTDVGVGLMQGPHIDRQAFVKCLLLRDKVKCDPFSAVLARGELAYIEKDEKQSFMIIGRKREGPYAGIRSKLFISPDNKHYAYIVNTDKGQQVVINGKIMPPVYEAIYRPRFIDKTEFVHLGIKESKVFRVSHVLPRQ